MAKKRHKYKIGKTARFTYFDGSTRVGIIKEASNYMGHRVDNPQYSLPVYYIVCKIKPTTSGCSVMNYPGVPEGNILEIGDSTTDLKQIVKVTSKKVSRTKRATKAKSKIELDKAIDKQKKFLNHKS